MFALIDCNNFYVSCERLFRPELKNRAVVVLSNNDGCIVSRSNEVKAAGIRMGAPYFQVKKELETIQTVIFSSNFALYADLSARIMEVIGRLSSEIEIYSIDEAFISLRGLNELKWDQYGEMLRDEIYRNVGIPVSVGLACTKTLAKVAVKIAKKSQGVASLYVQEEIEICLRNMPVEDIWGIGRKKKCVLHNAAVQSAFEFSCLDEEWVQRNLTITGLRTLHELKGIACMKLEQPVSRKSMIHSRTFGNELCSFEALEKALATFASRLGEKLRKEKLCTQRIHIFFAWTFWSFFKKC